MCSLPHVQRPLGILEFQLPAVACLNILSWSVGLVVIQACKVALISLQVLHKKVHAWASDYKLRSSTVLIPCWGEHLESQEHVTKRECQLCKLMRASCFLVVIILNLPYVSKGYTMLRCWMRAVGQMKSATIPFLGWQPQLLPTNCSTTSCWRSDLQGRLTAILHLCCSLLVTHSKISYPLIKFWRSAFIFSKLSSLFSLRFRVCGLCTLSRGLKCQEKFLENQYDWQYSQSNSLICFSWAQTDLIPESTARQSAIHDPGGAKHPHHFVGLG